MTNNKAICYIAGAGEPYGSFSPTEKDLVIAADGGYDMLDRLNISPDLSVGDFDSNGKIPENCPVLRVNTEKDITDTALAVSEGLARGFRNFKIYGGLGKRLDHTLANIQLVCELSTRNCKAELIGENITVTAITNGELKLAARKNGTVSVFSHTDISSGVTLKGLKYPLENHMLTNVNALGVSNEFINKPVTVSVTDGTLVVMLLN